MNEKKCRQIVAERAGNKCEICEAPPGSMHHRRFRSQGGPWTPSNILRLCGDGVRGCHGKLTNTNGRRAEYEAEGWIVPAWKDWQSTPVKTWRGYLLLDDEGGWTNLGPELPAVEHTAACSFWFATECSCGGVA